VKVYVKINGREGVHPATVLRTRGDGYRVLDTDGGPPITEGQDCEVVPAPESCGKCWRCDPNYRFMRLCPTCGNKRCPHASDHDLACTNSNEPGQPGSIYVGGGVPRMPEPVRGPTPSGLRMDAPARPRKVESVWDPVAEARAWATANHQAPGAEHVLAALASAARYRRLAEEATQAPPGGTRVVVVTLGGKRGSEMCLTSPHQKTDEEIAKFISDYFRLLQVVSAEIQLSDIAKALDEAGENYPGGIVARVRAALDLPVDP
jgi:hypothetical protein